MDLQEIQNKLNTLLAGTERKIVFWYDDDAEYIDDRYSHLSGDVCGRQYIVQSGKLTNGNKCYYIIEVYEDFYENIYGYYQQLKVYENGQIEILDEGTTLG